MQVLLGVLYALFTLLFCGFLANANNLPGWLSWAPYLSCLRYMFELVMSNEILGKAVETRPRFSRLPWPSLAFAHLPWPSLAFSHLPLPSLAFQARRSRSGRSTGRRRARSSTSTATSSPASTSGDCLIT